MIVVGILLVATIGLLVYFLVIKLPATKTNTTAVDTPTPALPNTMQADSKYAATLKSYTETAGFGNARNSAIVIVGDFMVANGLSGDPKVLSDANLRSILTAADMPTASNLILRLVPATSMQMDINYKTAIGMYNSVGGFGSARNVAIVIVGNFMAANKITGNPQSFTDGQLYSVMMATSPVTAVAMLKGI